MFATQAAIAYDVATFTGDGTLAALVTGGWHLDAAPQGTVEPYGVIHQQSAPDVRTLNRYLIHTDVLVTIRVIGDQSLMSTLVSAYKRVDDLLDVKNVTAPDGTAIAAIERESELTIPELVAGKLKMALGGTYRHYVTT